MPTLAPPILILLIYTLAPYCGMIVRKQAPHFGYYQPAVFEIPSFQTFHQTNPSFQTYPEKDQLPHLQSQSSVHNHHAPIVNPVLTSFMDIDYNSTINPDKLVKLSQDAQTMMIHNISHHINQYRHHTYDGELTTTSPPPPTTTPSSLSKLE